MTVIAVDALCKSYRDTEVLRDISFEVERGEIFGILGPNGAGKTTTVECLSGLRVPDSGSVDVLGLDPRKDRARLRQVLGVQLQNGMLPDGLQVVEAVELYRSFYRTGADPGELISGLGLTEKRKTRISDLSGGQFQRLAIALALVGRPRIAILDELTTGLDPQARRDTWRFIENMRDSGVTVILVTHFLEEAQRLCDRVAVIDKGRIAALDSPLDLIKKAGGEPRVTFRTERPFDTTALRSADGVTSVKTHGTQNPETVVTGSGNLLLTVTTVLAAQGIAPLETQVQAASLDDAYFALIGHDAKELPA
ncbi:multidrug ABC transporter ATP-binding protein [Prauserella marina]|uniref:ABC-2 type transport system ATP-binding protein n=1 Tax=Prauserella marina TaxID=530584 RepID=A0A222W063_9PSEU|nr:ABC transporter ATP-binding protein [Prauserella marina]ASR39313.1 multidrug ABC transporter ATP-binding protein [Prauserella marina]PWV76886.1 ABC-2 type transport system ATP-binding protein [Prauserella marina]SDC99722.1 ABC-2 type transport system ATP-binding protein [Prauserella marina]